MVYLDVTRPFPFRHDTFDYVYCEHMSEHIDYPSAVFMLREFFRVLKPAATIRISTPDLKVYPALQSKEKTASQTYYIDWMSRKLVADGFLPEVDYCKEVFVINNAFRAWGHQFLYDRETLRVTMSKVGFADLQYYQPGVSNDDNLRGIESHGSVMGCEEINQFEAFAMEGRVPDPKRHEAQRTEDSLRPIGASAPAGGQRSEDRGQLKSSDCKIQRTALFAERSPNFPLQPGYTIIPTSESVN